MKSKKEIEQLFEKKVKELNDIIYGEIIALK